jgi:hypothetical protein
MDGLAGRRRAADAAELRTGRSEAPRPAMRRARLPARSAPSRPPSSSPPLRTALLAAPCTGTCSAAPHLAVPLHAVPPHSCSAASGGSLRPDISSTRPRATHSAAPAHLLLSAATPVQRRAPQPWLPPRSPRYVPGLWQRISRPCAGLLGHWPGALVFRRDDGLLRRASTPLD